MRQFRRAPRLPAALVYHRVCDTALDPLLLAVSPERFSEQMRVLRAQCHPLPVEEFARRAVSGTLPDRAVCVTFDDGYADNLHTAQPILDAQGVHGCVFVATGLVAAARETWWDAIEHVLLRAGPEHGALRLRDEGGDLEISCPDDDAGSLRGWNVERANASLRQRTYRQLLGWVHDKSPRVIETHLEALRNWAGVSETPRADRRLMSIDEVHAAARASHLVLGGHTVSHPVLSTLPAAEQEREVAEGRRQLEEWSGRPATLFAYPFGTYAEYGPSSRRAAARAGFAHAFANMPARLGRENAFDIPRLLVRDWDGATFARALGI
jgi:peptidoglycan/xylan/chitin deacetylase (PgdA/CDA1 family)